MNAPALNTMTTLTAGLIEEAKSSAALQGEPLLLALQRISGNSSDEMLAALARYTSLDVLSLAELDAMAPDFSVLGYTECLQRQCILLTDAERRRVFITANPLDEALYTWASYKISGYFRLAFTHPLELKALLSRLEAHQQALSQLIRLDQTIAQNTDAEEISLTSIAQDESQVVRLVNSTLYDAHKSGASDIHFENTLPTE